MLLMADRRIARRADAPTTVILSGEWLLDETDTRYRFGYVAHNAFTGGAGGFHLAEVRERVMEVLVAHSQAESKLSECDGLQWAKDSGERRVIHTSPQDPTFACILLPRIDVAGIRLYPLPGWTWQVVERDDCETVIDGRESQRPRSGWILAQPGPIRLPE
jgi:hypothetical protein